MVRTEGFQAELGELTMNELRQELLRFNPDIRPDVLGGLPGRVGDLYRGFAEFEQLPGTGLWVKQETLQLLESKQGTEPVVLMFVCGPPAGGKDFFAKWMEDGYARVVKILTSTSRAATRADDVPGVTYNFLGSIDNFMNLLEANVPAEQQFLEHEVHYDENDNPYRAYGMQLQALLAAMADGRPIMYATTDITKQAGLVENIRRLRPELAGMLWLSVYVSRRMRMQEYLGEYLQTKRPNDYELRGLVALEEFWWASTRPGVIWVQNETAEDMDGWRRTTLDPVMGLVGGVLSGAAKGGAMTARYW